jgi:hypothetical protein
MFTILLSLLWDYLGDGNIGTKLEIVVSLFGESDIDVGETRWKVRAQPYLSGDLRCDETLGADFVEHLGEVGRGAKA